MQKRRDERVKLKSDSSLVNFPYSAWILTIKKSFGIKNIGAGFVVRHALKLKKLAVPIKTNKFDLSKKNAAIIIMSNNYSPAGT